MRKTQTGEQKKKGVLEENDFILGVHQNQVKKTRQRIPDLSESGLRNFRKSSRCHSTASNSNREEGSVMLWRSQKVTPSLESDLSKEKKRRYTWRCVLSFIAKSICNCSVNAQGASSRAQRQRGHVPKMARRTWKQYKCDTAAVCKNSTWSPRVYNGWCWWQTTTTLRAIFS